MKKMKVLIEKILVSATTIPGVLILAGILGGCAMDDVELNGGVFNALGFNNPTKPAEPKLAARAPLVIPPTTSSLPIPGEQPEAQVTDVTSLLNDPDRLALAKKADLERQQAEFCSKNYDPAKTGMDDIADLAQGPLGPCRKSILTSVSKWNANEDSQTPSQ